MTQRIYTIGLVCALAVAAVSAIAENDRVAVNPKAEEDKMSRMKELLRKQDVDIVFYGKVLDQYDMPVEGAVVDIQITQFSPDMDKLFGKVKSVKIQTDVTGSFVLEGEKGRSIYVKEVSKTGYEYIRSQNENTAFEYSVREGCIQRPFTPAKDSPVIFRLRKQSETTFCLGVRYWDTYVYTRDSGKPKGYDFIRQEPVRDLATPIANGEVFVCDLQVKATFNTNNSAWTVVLSPGDTNGGIIVSEQLLYEAPEAGYQPEYTFTPQDRKPVAAKYVYLKSRDPAIYTRLEIEYINANKNFFRLSGRSVTNPYGERNLEEATDLPYEVTKQLADEAKAAFRENKRPEKPDISKLIREGREKGARDKL